VAREAEVGDLLFAVVNWARWLEVDPEVALRQANARFARRFRAMECKARERDRDMSTMDIDALEALRREAKLAE
jgi:ATP diphosphatase